MFIVGSIQMQKNIVSIILWQKDGTDDKNILPLVESVSCSVHGMSLSDDSKFLLAESYGHRL